MAKKTRRKLTRQGDPFKLRMVRMLARHGLTMAEASRLSDADLRRHRGVGRIMIAAIRATGGPAPPPSTTRATAAENARTRAAAEQRVATLERQVAELLEAVRQLQDLLRVRGIDRRAPLSSEASPEGGREAPAPTKNGPDHD
jgi:transposase-like protein